MVEWRRNFAHEGAIMVVITFPDEATQLKGLGFLLRRFSGMALSSGEHFVPEAALAALAHENIPFSVHGPVTYEKRVAALRAAATSKAQKRPKKKS
jgi:hypothetical protein